MQAGLMKRDRKLVAANLRDNRIGCNRSRMTQKIALVAAEASVITKDKSPLVPKETQCQPFGVKSAIQCL